MAEGSCFSVVSFSFPPERASKPPPPHEIPPCGPKMFCLSGFSLGVFLFLYHFSLKNKSDNLNFLPAGPH